MRRKGLISNQVCKILGIVFSISIVILLASCGGIFDFSGGITEEAIVLSKSLPEVRAVIALQNRHAANLLDNPEIVGIATGLTDDGKLAILVFASSETAASSQAIPKSIEDIPVVIKVTGKILALEKLDEKLKPAKPPGKPDKSGGDKIDPTSRFERPVPIGVSTGNEGECSAGTIGARVKDLSGNVYALSNNHVYALENSASIGSKILQPGLYDTSCTFNGENVIGWLADYQPIDFGGGDNLMDAAVASSSTEDLGNATPENGYGMPKSDIVTAGIGQNVQKYGRTTALTKGTITAIGATVKVGYSSGTAIFVDQIIVESRKPFIKAGDSGSLLVTNPDKNPVGLLFAGNGNGKLAVANPIDVVLGRFGVTIDGE